MTTWEAIVNGSGAASRVKPYRNSARSRPHRCAAAGRLGGCGRGPSRTMTSAIAITAAATASGTTYTPTAMPDDEQVEIETGGETVEPLGAGVEHVDEVGFGAGHRGPPVLRTGTGESSTRSAASAREM